LFRSVGIDIGFLECGQILGSYLCDGPVVNINAHVDGQTLQMMELSTFFFKFSPTYRLRLITGPLHEYLPCFTRVGRIVIDQFQHFCSRRQTGDKAIVLVQALRD
jgi:hypothetical protein